MNETSVSKVDIIEYSTELLDDLEFEATDLEKARRFLVKHWYPADRRRVGETDDYVVKLFIDLNKDLVISALRSIKDCTFYPVKRNPGLGIELDDDEELIFWYDKKNNRFYIRGILSAFLSGF